MNLLNEDHSGRTYPSKNYGPFIAVLAVIILLGVAIFCTYLIVRGQIDANTTAIHIAQVKNSIGTCKALIALDNASKGIQFPRPGLSHPSELYAVRQSQAIHQIVQASHCSEILTLVKQHGIAEATKILFSRFGD